MTLLVVLLGGAIGAPLRYLIDLAIQSRHRRTFPWGTFTVNVAGSAVLGSVLAAGSVGALSPTLVALLGTGLCGALTTFSTFSFETLRLVQQGHGLTATFNLVLSLGLSFAAASGAWALTLAGIDAAG